jgi:citrate lyase beta subunit
MAKAAGLPADGIVLDLEDGVGPAQKSKARKLIAEALATLDFGRKERAVRINTPSRAEHEADLAALPLERIDTVFLPKVETADEVRSIAVWLDAAESRAGRRSRIGIIASIETPRGLLNALAIAEASRRMAALFFGSGDYALATGAIVGERMLAVPRALIVAAAAAAGIQAIDAAFFAAVKDTAATRTDALAARELGFSGKLVFHPSQIGVCNDVFSPTPAEIAKARRILAAWRAAEASGQGTALADGEFIAVDIARAAKKVLALAREAGLDPEAAPG